MHDVRLQPATPPERHRFHFLDALRGIAALLVAPIHAPHDIRAGFFYPHTFLAVDFFFCLSGFVVAFSYEKRLANILRLRDFALLRVLRLYPIAALGTLFGALTLGIDHSFFGKQISLAMLVPSSLILGLAVLPFPHGRLFPLDPPMWTLFMELLANLAYAMLMRFRLAASSALAGVAGFSFVALLYQRLHYGSIDFGVGSGLFFVGLARVGFSFFIGVLLYRLYNRRKPVRLHGRAAWTAGLAVATIFVAVLSSASPLTETAAAQLIAVAVIFPTIVYLGTRIGVSGPWAAACSFLGTISYPLYLLHEPFFVLISRLSVSHNYAWALMLVSMLSLVALAWGAARLYDEPLRSYLSARIRKSGDRRHSTTEVTTR